MPYYEVLCLAHGNLGRSALRDVVRSACRTFMDNGGIVTRVVPMGADGFGPRKLAYRIRRNQTNYDYGFYVNVCAFADPSTLTEVDRRLKLDERVLRHKTLRLPLSAALADVPDMEEPITRSSVDESDPSHALRVLIEQHARDFPDGFQFTPADASPSADSVDAVEELKKVVAAATEENMKADEEAAEFLRDVMEAEGSEAKR